MWYMIASELQKLWRKKTFLILLFVVISVNVVMLFYSNGQDQIPDKAYKNLDCQLQKMSEQDKNVYISNYREKIEGFSFIEEINLFAARNSKEGSEITESMKNENPQLYEKYYKDWKDKNYILFTEDIFQESGFMDDVKERTSMAMQYEKYLEQIAQKKEDALGISIFADSEGNDTEEDKFSQKVIIKTAEKYSRMSGIKTQLYTFKWMDNFTSKGIPEILLALLTFILVYQMIYEEKKNRLFGVIRAMPRGRAECIVSKVIALFINTGCVTFVMYGAVFIYSAVTVGIYGLDAPIQSVVSFIACPYKLSVWQFLLLTMIVKWITLFVFGLILLCISIVVSHYIITFAVGIALFGVNVLAYYFVSGISKWSGFHYLNLWQFLNSDEVVGNYILIHLFEEPKSVCMLMIIIICVLVTLLATVSIILFSTSKNLLNNKSIFCGVINLLKESISQIRFRQKIYKNVWGYESYKILVMNLGIFIIILFVMGMVLSGKNASCYLTPNEISYRHWMQNLNGEMTEEKEGQIQKQKKYYDGILKQLEILEQEYADGKINEIQYDNQRTSLEMNLAFYPAFQRVYERYEYVKEDSERQFVYEEGYNKLIGRKDHHYFAMFMVLNLVLILFLTTGFTIDKEKGMHNIIRTTPKGRGTALRGRVLIGFAGATAMYLCFFIRNVYVAQTNYGMESLIASASNLRGFETVPEGISILMLLAGFVLLQIIVVLIISAVIMFVAYKIGNTIHAIVWEMITLLIVAAAINQICPYI